MNDLVEVHQFHVAVLQRQMPAENFRFGRKSDVELTIQNSDGCVEVV